MDAVPEAKSFIIQFSKMINMYTFDLQDKNLTSAGLVIRVQQCPQSVEKGFSLPRSGVLPVQFMNIVRNQIMGVFGSKLLQIIGRLCMIEHFHDAAGPADLSQIKHKIRIPEAAQVEAVYMHRIRG